MKTTIVLSIEHTKEIPDLLSKVENRIHLIDGIDQAHPQSVVAWFAGKCDEPVDMEASE